MLTGQWGCSRCYRIMCGEQSRNAEKLRGSSQKSFSLGQTVTTSLPSSQEPTRLLSLVGAQGHPRQFLSSRTDRREHVGAWGSLLSWSFWSVKAKLLMPCYKAVGARFLWQVRHLFLGTVFWMLLRSKIDRPSVSPSTCLGPWRGQGTPLTPGTITYPWGLYFHIRGGDAQISNTPLFVHSFIHSVCSFPHLFTYS